MVTEVIGLAIQASPSRRASGGAAAAGSAGGGTTFGRGNAMAKDPTRTAQTCPAVAARSNGRAPYRGGEHDF